MHKTEEDSYKLNLLNDLSFAYKAINADEGMKYGQQGLILAQQLEWEKGMTNADEMIGVNYYSKSDYTKAL